MHVSKTLVQKGIVHLYFIKSREDEGSIDAREAALAFSLWIDEVIKLVCARAFACIRVCAVKLF